ncbi:hypothetical protein KC318_g9980 [Hortaea werneckii]|nr:hypothetical protein KC334_g15473 [Hortaea werneckii]KAI7660604.1 hypothetical protein KC318_g9980 [Hortaea werneckii]RMY27430.1 hypothetical protein D0866_10156 [Hortaea werneckii]
MKINVAVKQRIYRLRNCTHVAGNKFKSLFNIKRDDPKLERQVDACHGQDCVNPSKLHGSSETSLLDHPLPPVEGGHVVDTSPLESRSKTQEVETEASPSSLSGDRWIYNGEGAKCLTGGPTKLVLASDGSKPCMTIIPSTDLTIRLQETIKESRKVSDAEDAYLPKIAKLRDMHTDVDLRVDGLHQRATKLERKKEWAEKKKDDYERLLKNKQTTQRSNVLYMLAYFEDAFVDSKLVDPLPPAAPVSRAKSEIAFSDTASYREAFGLQGIPQGNSKALDERSLQSRSSGIAIWEDPDYDLYEPSPTKATNDAEAVIWRYESAMTRLRVMQQDFDDREERFEQEAWDRMERQVAGEDFESDLAFDHRQIHKTRELASRLTEAEDLVEAAKTNAVAMGVQIPDSDIESRFVDDVDDGYRISSEAREAAGVDKDSIVKWMTGIPEEEFEGMTDADVDEWDCRSVAISESGSMVAEGSDRTRIDKWRSMCEAIKQNICI